MEYKAVATPTKIQAQVIESLKARIFEHACLGKPEEYEFKRWDVRQFPDSPIVFVYSVVGQKGDEGSISAIYCRDARNILIGKKGKLELLNARDKPVTGWEVSWALTK